jgi:ribA/ribD-fused uncharacterized protein
MIVNSFRGDFEYLSNFSKHGFVDKNGRRWKTVEHFYQSMKTNDEKEMLQVQNAKTPTIAKLLGRKITLRKEWNDVKVDVMREALRLKFDQNDEIRQRLKSTAGYVLIEGNNWGDTFWGEVDGKGLNILGKLLMELRDYYLKMGG